MGMKKPQGWKDEQTGAGYDPAKDTAPAQSGGIVARALEKIASAERLVIGKPLTLAASPIGFLLNLLALAWEWVDVNIIGTARGRALIALALTAWLGLNPGLAAQIAEPLNQFLEHMTTADAVPGGVTATPTDTTPPGVSP